jgi:transcriptional regulator of acetoin/glycerol metabolism
MSSRPRNAHVEAELLPYFPHSLEVPPLRHHMNDLRALVAQVLEDANRSNTVTLAPAAMNQLMRLPWRGNVEQLHRVLNRITQVRRNGVVNVDDLPAECRALIRRQLTQMEALERDAICTSLAIHHGNKHRAAEDLGMSRATIYRRIRQYGIT